MDEREADLQRMRERLRQSYAESAAQKQSRQIKMTTKIPTPASKRRGGGSSSVTSYKSPLMKKAKIEHLQSCALKNPKPLNNQAMKTGSSSSSSASRRVSSLVSLNNGPDPTIPINNRQLSPGANSLTRPSQASARPTGTANQTRPITVRPTQAYANQRPASGTSNLTRATPARLLCTANQRGTAGTTDHARPTSTPSQLRKPTGTPRQTGTSSLRRLPANPSSQNRAQNQYE